MGLCRAGFLDPDIVADCWFCALVVDGLRHVNLGCIW